MEYQLFSPPAILQPVVKYIWVLKNNTSDNFPATFTPLADGCPGIMFQQREKGQFYMEDKKELPDIFLYGQTIEPVKMYSTGPLETVGVCFHPHALQAVFGIDAHELTGNCVDFGLLQHKKERHLSEKLFAAKTIEEQINALSGGLLQCMQRTGNRQDAITQFALAEIAKHKGTVSFKALHQKMQLSERTFERRFKQSIGISAKLYSRIIQFQDSLNQLRKNNYQKLSDVAYENNYADQSHFIRSFKEFAGVSPFDYRKQLNEVAENFPSVVTLQALRTSF